MPDFSDIMKKAQEMQAQMATMQSEMANLRITGSAGAGLVSVTVDGKGMMMGLTLDPSLFSSEEKDVVEDLVVAAYKDARDKVEAAVAEKMQEMGGGMAGGLGKNLADMMPDGFKFPF